MRISSQDNDPGFVNFRANLGARVFLNEVELRDVFTADEEQGIVVVAARDEHGKLMLDGDCIARKTMTGVVRVEPQK